MGKIKYRQLLSILICTLCLMQIISPATSAGKGYVVGEGDTLKISVYNHDDLETTVRVGGNGDILLPLLGRVIVEGLTVSEVTDKISKLLNNGYIINPQVNVFIVEFRSKKVVILGQIFKPGVYELSGPTTFLELLSKAGGLTDNAGDRAIIKSENKDLVQKFLTINIKSLLEAGDLKENVLIQDGDNVYIEKSGICYVTGEVKKPGAYKIDEYTTVIKAIALAEGFTGKASKKSVNIIRVINGEKTTLEDIPLIESVKDEDIIIVPESFF